MNESTFSVDSSPSGDLVVVTPHDSTSIVADGSQGQKTFTRGLYVGGAGNLTVLTRGGQVVLLSAVPAGTILPIQVSRVNNTGTTATLIVAMF